MQRQAVRAESLRQDRKEALSILPVLKDDGDIVREPDQSSTTSKRRLHLPDEPVVEDFVQVDVRQER
jgi:hypothetical protein